MSETELKKIGFSDPYRSSDWQTDDEYPACHYLANEEDYPGVGLMINDNRLVRIDVGAKAASTKWQTLSGATIGMTETEIAAIYGSWMKMDYHPYLGDSGSYLTLQSGDGRYRMIFETATPDGSGEAFVSSPSRGPNSRKRVTNFRAGLAEPVGYIEGCS